MKQRLKKLKFLFAITLAGILLFGCQVDKELTNENLYEQNGVIMHKKFDELIQETQFKTAFDKINQPNKGSSHRNGTTSKTVMENRYGFTIADYPANVVVFKGITSYTFFVTQDSMPANHAVNLIVNLKENEEPKAYLYEFERATDFTTNNPIKSNGFKKLNKIIYNIDQVQGLADAQSCEFVSSWVCNGSGHHSEWVPGCTGHAESSVVCTGGGGSTQNNSGHSGSGSSKGPYGNNNVVTAPVGPKAQLLPQNDPCEAIKPTLDPTKADLKSAIVALQPCAGQSAGECGTSLVKNATGIFGTNPLPPNPDGLSLNVPDGGDVYGSIHTHPLFPSAIAMFSWGDVHSLFQTYDKSGVYNGNNVTIILVVKTNDAAGNLINNTYALTINNPANFLATMDAELNAMEGTIEEKKEIKNQELKFKYQNVGIGSENWEKGFLNYFKDYNLSLMKANSTLTGWNELKVNDTKIPYNQQTVTINPC